MPQSTLTIRNQRGLHARAASKFVKLAGQFDADIKVAKDGQEVSGRSIMGLMMLAAAKGSVINIQVDGADEGDAMTALVVLIQRRFDEAE